MRVDGNGYEVLEVEQCMQLLRSGGLGRLALSRGALPIIVPMAYQLDGPSIVLPVASELVRQAAEGRHVVCFETDSGRAPSEESWSVVAIGHLQPGPSGPPGPPLGGAAALAEREATARLQLTHVSGRRMIGPG